LMFFGSYISTAIQTWQILYQNGFSMDLLCSANYDVVFDKTIQKSLHNQEQMFVVLDQKKNILYESLILAKLTKLWFGDIEVNFIYPDYTKITSVLDEYKFEQAEFDWWFLAEKIISKISA